MQSKHISTSQAAVKWKISARRVAVLCETGRVDGAEKTGNTWIIPSNAKKPADARVKSGKYIKRKAEEEQDG
ncbi:MAG: DNA-binding protein [Candidatus Gastranaerophilaceae bacterium]